MEMEENNSIVNNELKDMRIRENPIEISGSLLVDDRLEEQGIIKIYEYIGRTLYLEPGNLLSENAPLVAWISIKKSGNCLKDGRVYHEFGYDELEPLLKGQAEHFAEFYGYSMESMYYRKSENPNL